VNFCGRDHSLNFADPKKKKMGKRVKNLTLYSAAVNKRRREKEGREEETMQQRRKRADTKAIQGKRVTFVSLKRTDLAVAVRKQEAWEKGGGSLVKERT